MNTNRKRNYTHAVRWGANIISRHTSEALAEKRVDERVTSSQGKLSHSDFSIELLNPPTVADYFAEKLGAPLPPAHPGETELDRKHPASPAHPDFHIQTGCGEVCKVAIDTAARLIENLQVLFADAPARVHSPASAEAENAALDLHTLVLEDMGIADPLLRVKVEAVLALTRADTSALVEDVREITAGLVNCYVYG
jgi:hypothetical protein